MAERPALTDPGAAALVAAALAAKRKHRISFWVEAPLLVAIAFVFAVAIKAVAFAPFYIPSGSMRPTLLEGDRILVNKISYRLHSPGRGDVVVFKQGDDGSPGFLRRLWNVVSEGLGRPPEGSRDLVKRVIALPGETVEVRTDGVYVNGAPLSEPWLPPRSSVGSLKGPVTIPKDQYWVMGDNRANSSDSRVFGPIRRGEIVGRAIFIVWPPRRIGGI